MAYAAAMGSSSPASPFGLGWARRLADLSAPPDSSLRERFDRQLFVGILAASAGFFLTSAVVAGPFLPLFEVVLGLVPPLFSLTLIVVLSARGGRIAPYVHVFLALGFAIPTLGALLYPGAAGWANAAWMLVYPLTAALLTGARGGVVWTVITIAAAFGVAGVQMQGLWPAEWTNDDPLLQHPLALGGSLVSVAVYQMLVVTWFIQQRQIVEALLADEQRATEALLANVLPASIAQRLRDGEVIADQVDEVTVVFADLVGFTALSEGLPARRVVAMLGEVFAAIDQIAEEEGVEKVKTIGDCYMAIAGAPLPCDDHADRALRFACRVRDRVDGWEHFGAPLRVRIGVHSGPAMAGVLGDRRLLYDLWGDTVNAASRLETAGAPGQVHASEATLRLARQRWQTESRGEVPLRGRAPMRTSFVKGPAAGQHLKLAKSG